MSHDVFTSYSRRDLAAVKPIKEELERLWFSCWMDPEDIKSGSDSDSGLRLCASVSNSKGQ